jgi:centrosomal protein CEP19
MENVFAANVVKPGDPGYVYDKQVEFTTPTQANEWDDEEDEE